MLVLPANFETARSKTCRLPAACFVKPKNAVEVAVALKVITITGSKFAVRNAGHNPNPGWAGVDGSGVTIDVSSINSLKLSEDKKIVKVGTGNKWGGPQELLDKYNMSAVGGINMDVGVSGVLLGGKQIKTN